MLEVKELRYIEGFILWLSFSDGAEGSVDLESSIWGSAFEPLREISFFKKAFISPVTRTVTWPNNVDFAPEYLKDKLLTESRVMQALDDVEDYLIGS